MQGIDGERVSAWLSTHVDGAEPPFDFSLITGGRSNLTFRVVDATGRRFVLRRPPLGHVLATAHDMAREHRILTAVGKSDVPVPVVLGLCTDESVNGAPFYVMDYVDGVVLDSPEKGAALGSEQCRSVSQHLIDVLADLHAADIDAIGLGDLARRDGYVERQVKRWSMQWAQSKTRELPAIDEVASRLTARLPEHPDVSIAHGDFRFGNCLVEPTVGSIAAVLDWELCTLGDPLADLGYLGVYWAVPGGEGRHNDPTSAPGFITYPEALDRYATRTGRDVSNIGYYIALGAWRLAVISEGVYARYLHGAMGDQSDPAVIAQFGAATEQLAEQALAALPR